jgi:integrase
MASIFKQQYTAKDPKTGKKTKKKSAHWYIDYKTADGTRKRVKGFKDRAATTQLAAKLEREAELVQAGIVDRFKQHRKKPLVEHLSEFRESLMNKGTTKKQACLVYNRANAVISNCRFIYFADISGSRVQRYLAERRRNGLSIRTSNFYLQAIKQLLNWLVADGRTPENHLAYLRGQDPKKDPRHERRALTLEETNAVLTAALKGRKHHNLTGNERYLLYMLALTTGFRAKELASLVWQQINLSKSEPSITVLVAYAKNDKEVTLPLRQDVAEQLRQWCDEGGFSPSDKLFPKFNEARGADMLRKDLEVAGVSYQDESGRFADFHSLRHSFCTQVIKSGATPKEAQTLARHSTSALTLDVYGHICMYDERRVIEKLPPLSGRGEDRNGQPDCRN